MIEVTRPHLGFIGLGEMGAPVVGNLVQGGYRVTGFDLDAERRLACVASGMIAASSGGQVVEDCDVVLTSLPSSDAFVGVAENVLLPAAREGQLFVDLGTTTPPEARRLAAAFAEKGADLVDAPVSGGGGGAEKGTLYIFAGGTDAALARCRPLFDIIGDPEKTTHCGPPGSGQVVKGVNQLMMGLVSAAYVETVAFGVLGGVDAETVAKAVGGDGRWRHDFNHFSGRIAAGEGNSIGVKFRELPYFLREAEASGFTLPLTRVLYDFCDKGERVAFDDHRPAPSFWHQLCGGADQ